MLDGGNLLLNIGPAGDGSVPADAVKPLRQIGKWLSVYGEAYYGRKARSFEKRVLLNQVCHGIVSLDHRTVYAVCYIWPKNGYMCFGGLKTPPKKITLLSTGEEIAFDVIDYRILLKNLPSANPDPILGIPVMKLEFDEEIISERGCYYPQISNGVDLSDGKGNP